MSEGKEQPVVIAGERTIPAMGSSLSGGSGEARKKFVVLALMVGGVVVSGFYLAKFNGSKEEKKGTVASEIVSPAPTKTFGAPPRVKEDLLASYEAPPTPSADEEAARLAQAREFALLLGEEEPSTPKRGNGGGGGGGQRRVPTLDKGRSSLMVSTSGQADAAPHMQSIDEYVASLGAVPGTAGGLPAASLGGAVGRPASASPSRSSSGSLSGAAGLSASFLGDRNFILAQGSFIECVLQTRLDSTVPGMTSCVVSRNIFSDNGRVLLIERGSTVSGEYQADIQQGQARIYVLWSRIKTPNGVVVALDSPATDPLGGAGLPGKVNNHFFARFGAALLLSLVDDVAGAAVASLAPPQGQTFNFGNTAGAASGAAQEIIKSTIQIKPTLTKNQGEVVGIYVAKDLDFSGVYRVSN